MKCEYKGCEKRAVVYLRTVNMHYCRKHIKEVAAVFALFRQHANGWKKKYGGRKNGGGT
jgi:hypothetical protein